MIIISSRENFNNSDKVSLNGDHIREVDFNSDSTKKLKIDDLIKKIKGKKILILVHGYNNEQFEVYDAYQIIEKKFNDLVKNEYDYIIGYSWPGGDNKRDWWSAKSRANSVARLFRKLIETLVKSSLHLDLMSHSLGARVCMKALKETPVLDLVRNYYCTAPAIDNECLEPNEEFSDAVVSCSKLFIFHSSRDGVLRLTYEIAERDRALGLYGPEDKDYISRRAKTVYVANCKKHVSNHGGYKRADAVYKYIKKYQIVQPAKFKTL